LLTEHRIIEYMNVNPKLTSEQKNVLINGATEAPFSGAFLKNKDTGVYSCANCSADLFLSDTKFDTNCGWPSFYEPKNNKALALKEDRSHGMYRVEVTCSNCGGHLGHVFDDAPDTPTGMRFCINSLSLDFNKQKEAP
jgi:peptide-methionine (R)-S-oxide reductase